MTTPKENPKGISPYPQLVEVEKKEEKMPEEARTKELGTITTGLPALYTG